MSAQCGHITRPSSAWLFDPRNCKLAHQLLRPWGTFRAILVYLCLPLVFQLGARMAWTNEQTAQQQYPYCVTLHRSLCDCLKTSSSFCCQSSVSAPSYQPSSYKRRVFFLLLAP